MNVRSWIWVVRSFANGGTFVTATIIFEQLNNSVLTLGLLGFRSSGRYGHCAIGRFPIVPGVTQLAILGEAVAACGTERGLAGRNYTIGIKRDSYHSRYAGTVRGPSLYAGDDPFYGRRFTVRRRADKVCYTVD